MKSLCVYCGSKFGNDPIFKNKAIELGEQAAKRGWRIVYGGGKLGLMGATAGAAHNAGGQVFGVIPEFLVDLEGILEEVDHKIVQTMHERKMMMFEECDAIVTLPGGIGTLEEIIEVLSWSRLSLHHKPIIVYNVNNFWQPLQSVFEHVVNSGFADPELLQDVTFVDNLDEIFAIADNALIEAKA